MTWKRDDPSVTCENGSRNVSNVAFRARQNPRELTKKYENREMRKSPVTVTAVWVLLWSTSQEVMDGETGVPGIKWMRRRSINQLNVISNQIKFINKLHATSYMWLWANKEIGAWHREKSPTWSNKSAWVRSAAAGHHRIAAAKWISRRAYGSASDYIHCVSKNGPTLKRYSSKLHGSILTTFGRNIRKTLE